MVLPDRTDDSPTIGAGLQPAFAGVAGPGAGVYRLRPLPTHPLCEQWVEWLGEDRLLDFDTEDLRIVVPLTVKKGQVWPDPRAGAMQVSSPEPWSPLHRNTMVGWWRPPFRRLDKKRGATAEVLAWCRYSYPSYLLHRLTRRRIILERLQEGYAVELYRGFAKLNILTTRDLERAFTLLPCLKLPKDKLTPTGLLKPQMVTNLKLELDRLKHIRVQPGCLSAWAATALELKADVPEKSLYRIASVGSQPTHGLMLKLKGQLSKASNSFFFIRQESDAALRSFYALWLQATPQERLAWDKDLTLIARAIRAASLLSPTGLSMARNMVKAGPATCGAVQHFRNLLNVLEGSVASVRAQLI
jgi:hypothetical protein